MYGQERTSVVVSRYELSQLCDLSATVRLTCGLSGPVNVSCTVTGREVESVVCSYDNGTIVEDCKQIII